MIIKTKKYDTTQLYPVGAELYMETYMGQNRITTKISEDKVVVGKVLKSPTKKNKKLKLDFFIEEEKE